MDTRNETQQPVAKHTIAADQAKAKAVAAKAVAKNTPMLKDVKTAAKPVEKKPKPLTFADRMDELIHTGGTWEQLIAGATEAAKAVSVSTKVTRGHFNAHIAYRMKRNEKYMAGLKVTEKGIEKTAKK